MKKILTVSLVAMMAVSAARADIASVKYVQDMTTATANTASSALDSAKTELEGKISTEAQAREQADTEINTTIGTLPVGQTSVVGYIASVSGGSTEALDEYKQTMTQTVAGLNTAISDETTRAEGAEAELDGKITAMDGAYKAADQTLQGNIDTVSNAVATEKSRAEGVEAELDGKITAEAQARAQADTDLETAYKAADTDLSDRIAAFEGEGTGSVKAQIAVVQGEVDTLEGTVADMDAAYKAADETLQDNIDAEAAARAQAITDASAATKTAYEAADQTLDGKITAEAQARAQADEGLAADIAAINNETTGALAQAKEYAQPKSTKMSLGAADGVWTDLTSATVGYATDGLYTLSLDKGSIKWVKVNEGSAN